MPVSLVAGIYTLRLLWKCRCRVKGKRERSKSIIEVDKIPTREIEIDVSPKTVASYFIFGTNSGNHGSREFKFADNEKSKSKPKTDRVKDLFLPICSLKTTKAKPLVRKQFVRVASTFTGRMIFSADPNYKYYSSLSNFFWSSTKTGFKLKEKFKEKYPFFGQVKGTNSLCAIDKTEEFPAAAAGFTQNPASAMKETLLSDPACSWASRSKPVNASTYVRPDKLPLISIDGVKFKDHIEAENLKPSVEDDHNKSPPPSGAKTEALKSSEVVVNDTPSTVAGSHKEPAASTAKDPPIIFKFTSQNSRTIPKSSPVFSADRSKISGTVKTRPSASRKKLKSSHGSWIPTSTFKQNKAMPGYNFGTPASTLEQNESKVVFGSTIPAFNTGSKLPVPAPDEAWKPTFGALLPHTTSVEDVKGDTINRSLYYCFKL